MPVTQLTTVTTTTATVAPAAEALAANPCISSLSLESLNDTPIKMERRESSTSESSLEHLDLDRTPKKLKQATSTPVINTQNITKYGDKFKRESTKRFDQLKCFKDSDEVNDCDHGECTHANSPKVDYPIPQEQPQQQDQHQRSYQLHNRYPYYKRYLLGGSHQSEKRASIQLEYNTDNPNSLRKRFRFNRNSADLTMISNESGFADSTGGSNNNYSVNHNSTNHNASKSNTSSAASTPSHCGQNDISSPESGIGEREDMKYVCPICEVVSATPHEFTNHIRCHNYASGDTENFTCRICSKVLSSASSLDRHVLVHTGERPFNCKYCHLTFTTNGNMHRHMRTHKQHQHTHHRRSSNKHHNFHRNNTAQNSTANINVNINSITKTPVANSTKNQSSETGNSSMRRNKSNNSNNNNNNNSDHSSHHLMITAISTATGGNSSEFNGGLENSDSDASSSSEFSIANSHKNNNDISLNDNNYKRKLDKQEIDFQLPDRASKKQNKVYNNSNNINNTDDLIYDQTKLDISNYNDGNSPELVCPVCNEGDFSDMFALNNHMDTKHPEIPAKCKHCQVIFRTHYQLNIHPCEFLTANALRTGLLKSNIESQSATITEACINKKSTCPSLNDCNEDNENEQNFENTTATHQAMLHPFYLKNSITNGMVMKNHQSVISTQETEQNDDDIKTETTTPDVKDLADIQSVLNMTSSSNTSNFLKNFEQSVNTPSSQHSYDRDDEEVQDVFTAEFRKMKLRGEFPCKLCTVIFPNLRALKGHNRIHLSKVGPAGPFRCNMCPYQICDKTALVRHMRTHNGDRPYECSVCNYAFTTKANCERHLRNRHAKTTREEVKRSIIYHPSEDPTFEDSSKKMQLLTSAQFEEDNDVILYHQQNQSKDRSTPISHLKEMLTSGDGSPTKPVKIQVKSLDKLLDKASASPTTLHSNNYDICQEKALEPSHFGPIDMSLDAHVLDLSKKSNSFPKVVEKNCATGLDENINKTPISELTNPNEIKLNQSAVGNHRSEQQDQKQQQQQLFLASQQLLADPAQYLQHLYRNIIFPQLNPFCLSNSLLSHNSMCDIQKFTPFLSRMFGIGDLTVPHIFPLTSATDDNTDRITEKNNMSNTTSNNITTMLPKISSLETSDKSSSTTVNSFSATSKEMHSTQPHPTAKNHVPNNLISNGSVKMVLKNGVFMPKQKQRRYRTERPFACEHCSARFTLRSNMERHVKQQHPQFYAQRQRSCHQIMRGRISSNSNSINSLNQIPSPLAHLHNGANMAMDASSSIPDQVKYAILTQKFKSNKDIDSLQKTLAHSSSTIFNNGIVHPVFNFTHMTNNLINGLMEDDEPKLVIDEDDEDYDDEGLYEDNDNDVVNNECDKLSMEKEKEKQATFRNGIKLNSETKQASKKISQSILEQAIKSGSNNSAQLKSESTIVTPGSTMNSMIAHAPAVGKFLKEVARSPFKDESQDLVPVSKLVDNATCNSVSFNNYFRPGDINNHMEQSDEEGLVASGSTSESNNSGAEDTVTNVQPKKKSAYSLAPNRVSCPYCQRMFPWSSSLRRHILTHTGQKPFKCSHCPLLFTTKSNCDRHLLRKHGNIESATSVYVPTEDVSEPIPPPKSVEEIEKLQRQREEEDRKRKAEEACEKERLRFENERKEKENEEKEQQQQTFLKQLAALQFQQFTCSKTDLSQISSSELSFKCHLCESSFTERGQCLEHIKCLHSMEFSLLLAKGAIASDAEADQMALADDEERIRFNEETYLPKSGKYPDYNNRKVVCAFCMRRFWSTEDLRRHMRTHSGERPFQCEICLRKFTLKHSMLRHMKKHNGFSQNGNNDGSDSIINGGNSGSDYSDDEASSNNISTSTSLEHAPQTKTDTNILEAKIRGLLAKVHDCHGNSTTINSDDRKQTISTTNTNDNNNNNNSNNNDQPSDLIGNLLGISDRSILSKLMSSPNEAAKLLGVNQ